MEQTLHTASGYERYDRVWQRVAPTLEPYPGADCVRTGGVRVIPAADFEAARAAQAPSTQTAKAVQAAASVPAAASAPAAEAAQAEGTARPEVQASAVPAVLPGAEYNPCCMGSAAAEDLEVITGFIEDELTDQRHFLALSRQAPGWARQGLREIAEASLAHARRLTAAYYLITGEVYCPAVSLDRIYVGRWCPALRERYHAKACGGFNFARASDETTDPCLSKLLAELSEEEYAHAEAVLRMLERSVRA